MTNDTPLPLQVTAALITSEDRLLIAQRPPHKKFGLLWEFPGGKREQGESLKSCLEREIREELALEIEVGDLFMEIRHDYQEFCIRLHAYWCQITGGRLELREHVAYRWTRLEELQKYTFTAADQGLVAALSAMRQASFPEAP